MKKALKILLILILIVLLIFILWYLFGKKSQANSVNQSTKEFVLKTNSDGIPSSYGKNQIRNFSCYVISYNEENEVAEWAAYILTKNMVDVNGASRANEKFKEDKEIESGSALPSDYKRSGYDRGHLVPAADMNWSQAAMDETFYMSNMCPQNKQFNRGIWKSLEEKVRDWAVANDSLYVVSGPVLKNIIKHIGKNNVSVPEYFYKVIVDISYPDYKGIAFLMKNEEAENIYQYAVTIDSVEKFTGINFFELIDENEMQFIESSIDVSLWK